MSLYERLNVQLCDTNIICLYRKSLPKGILVDNVLRSILEYIQTVHLDTDTW